MANKQINELTAITTPAAGDLIPVYDVSDGSSEKTKKMTYSNFQATQCAFAAYATAQANMATSTKIQFDNEIFDIGGDFDAATTYRFTAPITGLYHFDVLLRLDTIDTASDAVQIFLSTNNRSYVSNLDPGVLASDPATWTFSINILADMTAGHVASVYFGYTGGAQQVDHPGTENFSWFSGYLVR